MRPQVLAIMQTTQPTITDEQLTAVYTDEMLVGFGRSLVALPEASRVGARDAFISSTVDSNEGAFTQDTAAQFFDAIIAAGDRHLVQ